MALQVVTGAYSYSGKYIARRLLECGEQVITLTGHPDRPDPFDGQVQVLPYSFDDPQALARSLEGVDCFYNTYWVRFDHGQATYQRAVENTRILFNAAREAGVRRIVHVSIANPSLDSPLPYYHGKAQLEADLAASGVAHAILRPTVIFGREDILINNIAWLVRRFPVFAVPGDGQYGLQPIYVEDLANLAVQAGQAHQNLTLDAVGPETYTFNELLALLAEILGRRVSAVHVSPGLALICARLLSRAVGDVMLTQQELHGLMDNLLVSSKPPTGSTSLKSWLHENRDWIGSRYASELDRHYRRS